MTLDELIDRLTEYRDSEFGVSGEAEVRIAFQPNYPLAANLAAVTPMRCYSGIKTGRPTPVVWLAASSGVDHSEHPYAPREAWSDELVNGDDDDE